MRRLRRCRSHRRRRSACRRIVRAAGAATAIPAIDCATRAPAAHVHQHAHLPQARHRGYDQLRLAVTREGLLRPDRAVGAEQAHVAAIGAAAAYATSTVCPGFATAGVTVTSSICAEPGPSHCERVEHARLLGRFQADRASSSAAYTRQDRWTPGSRRAGSPSDRRARRLAAAAVGRRDAVGKRPAPAASYSALTSFPRASPAAPRKRRSAAARIVAPRRAPSASMPRHEACCGESRVGDAAAARGGTAASTMQCTPSPATSASARSNEGKSFGQTGICVALVESGSTSNETGYASTASPSRETIHVRQTSADGRAVDDAQRVDRDAAAAGRSSRARRMPRRCPPASAAPCRNRSAPASRSAPARQRERRAQTAPRLSLRDHHLRRARHG